jgi:hypothetical protein
MEVCLFPLTRKMCMYGARHKRNYLAIKSNVKLSLCLTSQALRHEGVWGSGCIGPHIPDFGTSWR